MARKESRILDTGDIFPAIDFDSVDGGRIVLPKDFGQRWGIILFYRGHW